MPRRLLTLLVLGAAGAALMPATSALAVTPAVTCVAAAGGGASTVYFGYRGADPGGETLAVGGARNRFTGDDDRGQPGTFVPDAPVAPGFGDDHTFMAVGVDTRNLPFTWSLDGRNATADSGSPACAFDLSASLGTDGAAVHPGQSVQWRLNVRNDGTGPVPRSQIAVDTTGVDSPFAPAVAVPDELLPGETLPLVATTRITPAACFGTAVATAALRIGPGVVHTPETDLDDNRARSSAPVACTVDLQVVAATEALAYAPGQSVAYLVTVVNAGEAPVPVSAIRVTHSRAAALTPVGTPPAALEPGGTLVLRGSAPVTAAQCGLLSSTAGVSISDPTGRIVEGAPGNDTWISTVAVAGGACGGATTADGTTDPRLAVTATGPAAARRGRRGVYVVRVRNAGTRTARNLILRTTLPVGSVLAQRLATGDVQTGNVLWRRVTSLRAGGTYALRVRVRFARRTGGDRQLVARVEASNAPPVIARRAIRVR